MLDPKKWSKQPGGATELEKNAAKALRMKNDAGSQTTTPEHRTSHEGGVQKAQVDPTDMAPGIQGTHVENVSRSRGARVSDTGKSKT
ncbi:hypothetical protein [Bosea sp. 124]|uniref:hypothetical protein n=1 Tax=Bosea sp. 124 TaxID=2135642 RepID=UPI000D4D5603|nr:hypothetical protein [Bosea sp. 124]PTM42824.1 hypothetical protein C8D03_4423 [Bosea sp. 124]